MNTPLPAMRGGEWIGRVKVFALCAICATGLWGEAGRLLPAPFNDWYAVPYRVVGHWWHAHMPAFLEHGEQVALYQAVEAYILALLMPVLYLRSLGQTARDLGLRRAERKGSGVTLAGIVLTLPIGFWLTAATPDPWGSPLQEFLEFLTVVPEHFLIFGVFGTLLLPQCRLRWPSPSSEQWAQAVFAVMTTGLIFGLIHIGSPHSAVIAASFPLGLLFSYMTVYSGSIWPAVVAHCTLNLLPMAVFPSGA